MEKPPATAKVKSGFLRVTNTLYENGEKNATILNVCGKAVDASSPGVSRGGDYRIKSVRRKILRISSSYNLLDDVTAFRIGLGRDQRADGEAAQRIGD
jgi:hypothetical protein